MVGIPKQVTALIKKVEALFEYMESRRNFSEQELVQIQGVLDQGGQR